MEMGKQETGVGNQRSVIGRRMSVLNETECRRNGETVKCLCTDSPYHRFILSKRLMSQRAEVGNRMSEISFKRNGATEKRL